MLPPLFAVGKIALDETINRWLCTGERGVSSETIVSFLTGINIAKHFDHPYDPADLNRCVKLLDACPSIRAALPYMRECSATLARMVDRWDEMEAMFRVERESASGMAPKTYALMREIRGVD